MTCLVCGGAGRDRQGNCRHETGCPHFLRGPDPGGDPHDWPSLFDAEGNRMLTPGDTVTSRDKRDTPGASYVVLEAGIAHVSGDVARIAPADTPDGCVYRLHAKLAPTAKTEETPMQRETLTAREAVAILFPAGTRNPSASFRSGADVCESLAEHFGFTPDDYRRLFEPELTFEPGTVLACPTCGATKLVIWDLAPVAYSGGRVIAGADGRPEPDYDDGSLSPSIGDGGVPDNCSCSGCGAVWEFHDLKPTN